MSDFGMAMSLIAGYFVVIMVILVIGFALFFVNGFFVYKMSKNTDTSLGWLAFIPIGFFQTMQIMRCCNNGTTGQCGIIPVITCLIPFIVVLMPIKFLTAVIVVVIWANNIFMFIYLLTRIYKFSQAFCGNGIVSVVFWFIPIIGSVLVLHQLKSLSDGAAEFS